MAPFFGFHELNNKKLAVLRSDWGTSKTTELFLSTIWKGYMSLRLINMGKILMQDTPGPMSLIKLLIQIENSNYVPRKHAHRKQVVYQRWNLLFR